jgi:hypothetical protein
MFCSACDTNHRGDRHCTECLCIYCGGWRPPYDSAACDEETAVERQRTQVEHRSISAAMTATTTPRVSEPLQQCAACTSRDVTGEGHSFGMTRLHQSCYEAAKDAALRFLDRGSFPAVVCKQCGELLRPEVIRHLPMAVKKESVESAAGDEGTSTVDAFSHDSGLEGVPDVMAALMSSDPRSMTFEVQHFGALRIALELLHERCVKGSGGDGSGVVDVHSSSSPRLLQLMASPYVPHSARRVQMQSSPANPSGSTSTSGSMLVLRDRSDDDEGSVRKRTRSDSSTTAPTVVHDDDDVGGGGGGGGGIAGARRRRRILEAEALAKAEASSAHGKLPQRSISSSAACNGVRPKLVLDGGRLHKHLLHVSQQSAAAAAASLPKSDDVSQQSRTEHEGREKGVSLAELLRPAFQSALEERGVLQQSWRTPAWIANAARRGAARRSRAHAKSDDDFKAENATAAPQTPPVHQTSTLASSRGSTWRDQQFAVTLIPTSPDE